MIDKISIFFKRLSQLPQHLRKNEKIIILILIGIIFVSTGFFLYDQFFVKTTIVPEFGGVHIEGETGEMHSLIPILKQNDIEKDISKLIFSSLVKYNNQREIIGDLANRWEISPDGKTYTFHLKEAKWQDGTSLTADDVIFTISLIQNEQTKSPHMDCFQGVDVKKIDEETVSFNLKTPLAPFLGSLTVFILPQHLLAQVPPTKLSSSQFAKKPIGSGPFKLEKITRDKKGTSVILEANENYYFHKPYLNKFVLKIYQDPGDLQNAIFKNQVLGIFGREKEGNQNYEIRLPQYKAVFFNLNSSFLTKDFRKALIFSIDKNEILNNIQKAERIDSPILPGFLGYKESEKWEFNLDKAKQFLSKSPGAPGELTLLTTQDEENQKIAEILKKQWELLGIQINIDTKYNALFEKAVDERAYDLLLIGVNQKADPDPYPFWHSSQSKNGLNFSSFKNREIDKLIEEARQSMDQNLRRQKYEKFIDIIQNEVPAIFLYQPIYNYQINDKIKGIVDIQGVIKSERFWNIENWYKKTKRIKPI